MITIFKIFENVDNLDPYGEENWDDEKVGDTVVCVDAKNSGNPPLILGRKYIITNIYLELGDYVDVREIEPGGKIFGCCYKSRFKKIN